MYDCTKSISTKAAGVTFENRQILLEHLTKYAKQDIFLSLEREPSNPYDKNAIKVIAAVKNKGSAPIGYVNKFHAETIAPIMDAGHAVYARLESITGGSDGMNYGMNFDIVY